MTPRLAGFKGKTGYETTSKHLIPVVVNHRDRDLVVRRHVEELALSRADRPPCGPFNVSSQRGNSVSLRIRARLKKMAHLIVDLPKSVLQRVANVATAFRK